MQSQFAAASWIAHLVHLLTPCTSHLLLPVCLPADSHPDSCLGQVQGKKGNYTIWICLKKVMEQNVTSLLMAQQPNHSCHVSTQQELWQSGSGRTHLQVYWQGKNWANDQFLPDPVSRGIVLSDQLRSKLLADEAKLAMPLWLNLSFGARRPAQRAVTPLSP